MKALMLLLTVLGYFAAQDLRIRFAMLLNIRGAHAYVEKQVKRIVHMLFAFSKFFVDFRVIRETNPEVVLPRQFLLISNHQSLLDIPVLFYSYPSASLRFVGKKELFHYIVLVSVVFRIQRHARIDRKRNFANTMKEIERLGRRSARRGFTPAVFPEGTRARSGVLGPFHSGAVRTILRTAPLPVVSVAIDGGHRASRLRHFVANLKHLRYRVRTLSVYEPPKTKAEIDRMLEAAHAEISEQLSAWRSPTGPQAPA
jgi:1-acyl-sn-glycerol-3-phosphate acyltransferase